MAMDNPALEARRIAIAGMIALIAAMGIGRFVFTPLLPMMQHDAGLTITAGGWLAAANYFGYFAGALSAVWLHVQASLMVRIGLVLNAILLAAMGLGDSLGWWLAIRALAGIFSAWVLVFGSTVVLRRLAQRGHVALGSVMFAGVGIGIALSGLLCIGFVAAHLRSSTAWLVLSAVALLAAGFAWPAFQVERESMSEIAAIRRDRFRWTRAMVGLIAGYGLFGFGYIIPATFLPVIARDALADPQYYVWFWPACGIAAAASTLLSVPLARRLGDRSLLSGCYLAEALGIALPALSAHPAALAAGTVLFGTTFVVITVAALREARAMAPAHANRLIAAMTAAFAAGQIAGPVVTAHLVQVQGTFKWPLLMAAAALLLAVALLPPRAGTGTQAAS